MGDLDTASLLFSFPADIVILSIRVTTTKVVLHIVCQRSYAACPLCQQPSERVHGHDGRTVADFPCAGRRVILALTVRKFVCSTPTCSRRIFTERLPDLVQSYARMTNRLREALVSLGLATSAEVSERLAPSLGMLVSAPTLLRRLRVAACPPPQSVRILGVDDWGATRSCMFSCKNSRKEALTWGSAPSAEPSLNQVRLGQCSRARKGGH